MNRANISNKIYNESINAEKSNWKSDLENIPLSDIFESALGGQTFHILLVEDHLMSQLLVKRFLLKCGYTVDEVKNGEDAIEKATIIKYDVILMDLQLPGLDGFKTTNAIRALKNFNFSTPILALTASSKYDVREKMYAVGMNDYIGKPFNPRELQQKVKHYASA